MYLNIAIYIHEHCTYHKYTVVRIKSWYRSVTFDFVAKFEKWYLTAALDDRLLYRF